MKYTVRNIRLMPEEPLDQLKKKAAAALKISPNTITDWKIVRRSLDARKKNDIHYVFSLDIATNHDVLSESEYSYDHLEQYDGPRPVIVGFGPAGMFAGLILARSGLKPLIIERGQRVEQRNDTVDLFRKTGILNCESNAQFGEGGAGTFSDGKLNTGTHDSRISFILNEFFRHGASESVLYDAKPHIGTDVLVTIIKNIRNEILSLGGEIRFETKFENLIISDHKLSGITVTGPSGPETVSCNHLILAIGHSSRDTFEALFRQKIPMERKAFSMGARIEHPQKDINISQYGADRGKLPAADYSLSIHFPDGTSAYSFCMCPGGYVFAAASEKNAVCTNGMSYSGRSGANANSALLVTLHEQEFPGEGVLAGMQWQRDIERKAYDYALSAGPYFAPAQLVKDFLSGTPSSGPGSVLPTYLPGVRWGDIRCVLPDRITSVLSRAIPEFERKIHGFSASDAVLTAPETRSSSPVRILRSRDCESVISGLFPCGEGAGYAGGITSAAVDGVRCAEALIAKIKGDC